MRFLILAMTLVWLSACGSFQRHPDSGYSGEFLRLPDDSESNLSLGTPSSAWDTTRNSRVASKAGGRMPQAVMGASRSSETTEVIHNSDIILGMSQADVRESWGNPLIREVAGQTSLGNERWTYREFLPTKDGYSPQDRIVYFYQGRVVGWKTVK